MVARQSYPEVSPRVEYSLTLLGHSLSGIVRELDCWVEAHALEIGEWSESPAAQPD